MSLQNLDRIECRRAASVAAGTARRKGTTRVAVRRTSAVLCAHTRVCTLRHAALHPQARGRRGSVVSSGGKQKERRKQEVTGRTRRRASACVVPRAAVESRALDAQVRARSRGHALARLRRRFGVGGCARAATRDSRAMRVLVCFFLYVFSCGKAEKGFALPRLWQAV